MAYKEIVTKAVIGKAKKTNTNSYKMIPEEKANTVLGCWVINHTFSGVKSPNGMILVNGNFDVNVWYSYDSDKKTGVATKNFNYTDTMHVPLKDNHNLNDATDIIVRCLKQPTVSNVEIKDDAIELEIEKEMGVEIVGDTMVKISVEDDFDEYEELVDNVNVDDIKVNEEYLNNN